MNQRKKREVLAFVLLFFTVYIFIGSINAHGSQISFKDVNDSHWFKNQVVNMTNYGIINGYGNEYFYPNNNVTYGEFIKMAVLINDEKEALEDSIMNWDAFYYNKALEKNLFTQFDIPKAKLEWPIKRQDMSMIISRLIEADNNIKEIMEEKQIKDKPSINDITEDSLYYYEINKCYKYGIINGYPDGSFRPEGYLTRAEGATALNKLLKIKIEEQTDIGKILLNINDFIKEDWTSRRDYITLDKNDINLKIRTFFNGNLCSFDHNMVGFIYIAINGQIVEYAMSIPDETFVTSVIHIRPEEIDYLVCIPTRYSKDQTIKLIEAPFS